MSKDKKNIFITIISLLESSRMSSVLKQDSNIISWHHIMLFYSSWSTFDTLLDLSLITTQRWAQYFTHEEIGVCKSTHIYCVPNRYAGLY